jgi:protein-disulfide isomerase
MHRRLFVSLFKRSLIALILLCLGCSAQSNPADINQRIERQVRAHFNVPAQVKIETGERKPSEFPNYDSLKIVFTMGERRQEQDFLISKDNKTLVRFSKLDLTKDPYADVVKKIDTANRPWRGGKDAKVLIVNYDDFQCPFCFRMHQTLTNDILKSYGDKVKIVYKDYPLTSIHPWATRAAVDANCLAAQSNDAYWGFADFVHNNVRDITGKGDLQQQLAAVDQVAREQGTKFKVDGNKLEACVKAQDDHAVRASAAEADSVGVTATPTLFINGYKIDGAVPAEDLHAAIDRALREAAQTTSARK